ncbi:MAG: DUF4838 domain-containing protein [Planctomycetota bacterium]|nr:MAG: DUF4838 domain-containing protein [Planctomycetota bacterium]
MSGNMPIFHGTTGKYRLQHSLIATIISLSSLSICAGDYQIWTEWHNSLTPVGQAGNELTLAGNGETNYRIVIPRASTTQDNKAAEDLQYWLQQITGVQLGIINDNQPLGNNLPISIGRTSLLEQSGLPAANIDLQDEGYGIAVQGETLFLWGGRTRAAINAVYALLEEDLGCRWYSNDHYRIPLQPTLTFAPIVRTYIPPLKLRDPFYFVAFNEDWSLRNRTNAPRAPVRESWGGHMDYGNLFVHTFNVLVPPSQYFAEHPEYYMMNVGGDRVTSQLCTTNPEVIQLITNKIMNYLDDHPDTEIVSVSKNDNGSTCLCPTCKALDDAEGSSMASLLYLVNPVAKAIEPDHPDALISTLAYFSTRDVPLTMRPRHNVIIRVCNALDGSWEQPFIPAQQTDWGPRLEAWSAAHDKLTVWDYTVNFYHYLAPMPNMEVIAADIPYMVANNAEGIMTQGAYQSTGERDWMRSWVIAKLLWDPSRNWFELMQDFIWGHYGNAAAKVAEYNELLRLQGQLYAQDLFRPPNGIRFPMDISFLTLDFLTNASAIFDEAEALAENDQVLHRVERERLPIMYVKLERGPEFTGAQYGTVLDRFETIARREGVTHLRERMLPNLDEKLAEWRSNWEQYWYFPLNPNPADQDTKVSLDTQLSWTTNGDATSYNIYLGTTNPPEFQATQSTTTYDPGRLDPLQTWYWQVETIHDGTTTAGNIWAFTTRTFPDLDSDWDVDQEDFGRFQACFTGPAIPVTEPECMGAKFDNDSDVDRQDYAILQDCFSGANIPADPNCAD